MSILVNDYNDLFVDN